MKRTPIALSPRHQAWLYGALAILLVTGLIWAALHYWGRGAEDEVSAWEPRLMKIHGAAAMLALVMLGTLVPLHIKRAWHARRNRLSGALMIGWFGLLTVTGYGLYYSGGERLRQWTSWIHLLAGALIVPLLIWHVVAGWRAMGRRRAAGVKS